MAAEDQWYWTLETTAGLPVQVSEDYAGVRFETELEAEAWIGEVFADLLDQGVDAATLYEGERKAYGPMSLHP